MAIVEDNVGKESSKELMHVSAYLPKDLYKELVESADREHRSISSEIIVLVKGALKKKKEGESLSK